MVLRTSLPIGKYLNRKDFMLCALLGVLCLIFFKDTVLGGHLLLGNDFVTFYMGMKQFLLDEIHKYRSIPFWNPFIFGGIPFWAHFESTIFYPLDALFWLISPEKAYGYTVFAHLVLAGIFMYLLCRSLRFRPAGSFIAASVFTFNGFILGTIHDGQMFRIQAYTWIPLIIFFLNKALTSRTPYFYSTMAGMAWGLQILSGSPQDALYTLIAAFLFLGYHLKTRAGEIASSQEDRVTSSRRPGAQPLCRNDLAHSLTEWSLSDVENGLHTAPPRAFHEMGGPRGRLRCGRPATRPSGILWPSGA